MKYVVETVVSMFRLQCPTEYSAMGIPKLIHSLIARMKGSFPILLEKKKADLILRVRRGVEQYQLFPILQLLKHLLKFFIAKVSAAWQKIRVVRA